jgi:hypothetical protein
MPTVEELLGPRPGTVEELLGPRPTEGPTNIQAPEPMGPIVEPPAFNWDQQIQKYLDKIPQPSWLSTQEHMTEMFSGFVNPLLARGYSAYGALSRGTAAVWHMFDAAIQYVSEEPHDESHWSRVFNKMAQIGFERGDYYKKRAKEIGIGYLDELISEATGNAVPGAVNFALSLLSFGGLPAAEAMLPIKQAGGDYLEQFKWGLLKAAEYKLLGFIFEAMAPLGIHLRTPIQAGIFGGQAAIEAPPGHKTEEAIKGGFTGAGYAFATPGGELGLTEWRQLLLNREIAKARATQAIKQEVPLNKIEENLKIEPNQTWEEVIQNNGLKKAVKDKEGNKYQGNAEEMHVGIADRCGLNLDDIVEYGFIDKKGNYYREPDVKSVYRNIAEPEPQLGVGADLHETVKAAIEETKTEGKKIPTEPEARERSFVKTAMESDKTAERTKAVLNEIAAEDPFIYYLRKA